MDRNDIKVAYHYVSNKKHAEGSNFIKYSSSAPSGNSSAKYKYTVYFTDIPPEKMRDPNNPQNVISIFGKTSTGQPRWNRVENAYKANLNALPEGAVIYKEKEHIFTIDMSRVPDVNTRGIGLKMKQSLFQDEKESLVPGNAER